MFDWLKRKVPFLGSAFFRGKLPPRPADFLALRDAGMEAEIKREDGASWEMALRHPQWGRATILCPPEQLMPPPELLEYSVGLLPEEKEALLSARSMVALRMESEKAHVLRDRKLALRFLRAAAGREGVGVADHISGRMWSIAWLDDELSHDADLDVEAIFCLHAIRSEAGDERHPVRWLHSHGLAEIGGFDYDILDPSTDLLQLGGADLLRLLAFLILEKQIQPSMDAYEVCHPGGAVRLVEVSEFNRLAEAKYVHQYRDGPDDASHSKDRSILCEPESTGFVGRLFGGGKVRPSKFLSGPISDHTIMHFTGAATEVMADRARKTYAVFSAVAEDLKEFQCPAIAKLGYEIDGGGENEREHLWFEVHEATESGELDATLASEPFNIARMKAGQRARHPIERLTDWIVMTPAGPVNPRSLFPLRAIRMHKDELRAAMRKAQQ
ncbi:MAG: DUF4026 domain-containing protein [Planctomycetes bacterium]|nr:DUF4026 domain-containing protein [Planctomycetota bacterium]